MELIFFIVVLNLFMLGCVGIVKIVNYLEEKYTLSFSLCIIILANLAISYGVGFSILVIYIIESLKEVS